MNRAAIASCVFAFAIACAAGSADHQTAPAPTSASTTSQSLIDAIKGAGLPVRDAGTVEQPFFSVPAHVYVVEESDLQIYEFATAADAQNAAAKVGPNGMTIGTSSMHWMAPPHFFRKDRLVVNYLGSSEKVLTELRSVLGSQFAGQ